MTEDPTQQPDGSVPSNPLLKEATDWCIRMNGKDADKHQAGFEAWLSLGGVHRHVYSQVSELHGFAETLDKAGIDRAPAERGAGPTMSSRKRWRFPVTLAALCVAVSLAILFLIVGLDGGAEKKLGGQASAPMKQFQTAPGQIHTINLADGSMVTLDTDSLVTVVLGGRERQLRLERGRARFSVAHEARPFTVTAGEGSLTALGTVFDVSLASDQSVDVSLIRGAVLFRPQGERRAESMFALTRISAGYKGHYRAGAQVVVRPAGRAQTWPTGVVAFDDVPLAEVIAQANRYATRKIILSTPAIGRQAFHGTLRMNDTGSIARILAHAFSLRLEERSGFIELSSQ